MNLIHGFNLKTRMPPIVFSNETLKVQEKQLEEIVELAPEAQEKLENCEK